MGLVISTDFIRIRGRLTRFREPRKRLRRFGDRQFDLRPLQCKLVVRGYVLAQMVGSKVLVWLGQDALTAVHPFPETNYALC